MAEVIDTDLAYIAALVDQFGRLSLRELPGGSVIPEVTIQNKRISALSWLAEITGVSVVRVGKDYHKHQCSDHCPGKHTRVESETRRWQVSGTKATILLHAIEPFMRVQATEARNLVWAGHQCGQKPHVVAEMKLLGWGAWHIPEPVIH